MKKLIIYIKALFSRDPLKVNYEELKARSRIAVMDKNFMDAWGKLDNKLRARGLVK